MASIETVQANFRIFIKKQTANGQMNSFAKKCHADLSTVQGWMASANPTLKSLVRIAEAARLELPQLTEILILEEKPVTHPEIGVVGSLVRKALKKEGIDPDSDEAIERFAIASGLEREENKKMVAAVIRGEIKSVTDYYLGFFAFGLYVMTGEDYTIQSLISLQNKNPVSHEHERDNGECLNGEKSS